MAQLRALLFGEFHLQCGDQALTDCCPRRVQELLCFLLLHRDRAHQREKLASLLWGESSTARSKKNLRQTLWQLRVVTGMEIEPTATCLLLVDSDRVGLNSDADLWLDVAVFEQSVTRTRGIRGAELDAKQAQALCHAADLYRGDLLEGWYHDWCLLERERLQNIYLTILDRLADYCEACREYETGLHYATLSLRCDGARERTHRRLMRLYYLAGDRTAALRQYDHCVDALRRELAVSPAAHTVTLYEQIRHERYDGPKPRPVATPDAPMPPASQLPGALQDLRQIQRSLAEIQGQLQQAIRSVELSMKDQG